MTTVEATKTAASKGMAGMVVADSSISFVDGTNGILEYRGHDIRQLADHSTFEEVAFLLWNSHLPTKAELEEMRDQSRGCRPLPPEIITMLRAVPRDADPMAVIRSTVSMLAYYDPDAEDTSVAAQQRKACRLLGETSGIVATYLRVRQGKEPIKLRTDADQAHNFLWMLTGEDPDPTAVKALDQYLLLLAEHEMNASTFTARVTASTESDLHSAITSALGTLKGPLHGRAVQEAMEQFLEIGQPENVDAWFEKMRGEGQRVMGIGHRVYKVRDPRATPLYKELEIMVDQTGERRWFDIARRVEERALEDPYFRERNLSANVDFYSAPLLYSLGIPVDAFTCMFAMSRIVGWCAHVFEQQANNRLIRPLSNYVGEHQLPWVPIDQRS